MRNSRDEEKFIIDLLIKLNETIKSSNKANDRTWNIGWFQTMQEQNNQHNLENKNKTNLEHSHFPIS